MIKAYIASPTDPDLWPEDSPVRFLHRVYWKVIFDIHHCCFSIYRLLPLPESFGCQGIRHPALRVVQKGLQIAVPHLLGKYKKCYHLISNRKATLLKAYWQHVHGNLIGGKSLFSRGQTTL